MKVCPTCKSAMHYADSTFCSQDGARLEEKPTHHCGYEIGPFDKFCPKCGERIEGKRSQRAGQNEQSPANADASGPKAGTSAQESDDELTPREEALNRFHESREWNSRG